MAIPENKTTASSEDNPKDQERDGADYCLASGLRRKFLEFCEENPGADECRIFDL